jgi:hypothetical protein
MTVGKTDRDEASPTNSSVLAGLQLALFEIMWGTFDWPERIFAKLDDGSVAVYVGCHMTPSEEEWASFSYLLNEILDAVDAHSHSRKRKIFWGANHMPEGYVELLSGAIFQKLAERHAPWRLTQPAR